MARTSRTRRDRRRSIGGGHRTFHPGVRSVRTLARLRDTARAAETSASVRHRSRHNAAARAAPTLWGSNTSDHCVRWGGAEVIEPHTQRDGVLASFNPLASVGVACSVCKGSGVCRNRPTSRFSALTCGFTVAARHARLPREYWWAASGPFRGHFRPDLGGPGRPHDR
jgi:hypothetical protein